MVEVMGATGVRVGIGVGIVEAVGTVGVGIDEDDCGTTDC